MSICQRCKSTRILSGGGKCDDRSSWNYGDRETGGYVPRITGIGGGDYIEIAVCLDCGQLQGEFPISDDELPESLLPEEHFPRDKFGHFDGMQKSCYTYGCTDDCTAGRMPCRCVELGGKMCDLCYEALLPG